MDITHVLHKIRPNASWTVGDDYDSLVWMDESPKPTKQEIEAAWDEVEFDIAAKEIRHLRDRKLNETDWVVVKYSELGEAIPDDWKNYRQALRDISEQSGFPNDIDWPAHPTHEDSSQ